MRGSLQTATVLLFITYRHTAIWGSDKKVVTKSTKRITESQKYWLRRNWAHTVRMIARSLIRPAGCCHRMS